MNKRAIAILGAIFVLIVGTLIFIIIQRSGGDDKETETPPTEEVTPTDPQPEPEPEPEPEPFDENPVVKLGDDQVVSPVLFYQGDGVTYLNPQGLLLQHDFLIEDDKVTLTNRSEVDLPSLSGITRVLWPQSGNNFIAEVRQGLGERRWSVYNSDTNRYVELPPQVTTIDWLPQGNKIIYIWLDANGKSTLNVANPDNTGYQVVADIWENDDEIKVSPDGQNILFFRRESDEAKNSINLTTTDGTLFRGVVTEGYNYGVLWAPDSRGFLFGHRNSSNQYDIWVGDITQGAVEDLGVSSIVEKALWDRSGQFVYVAVPQKGNPQTGLTEDSLIRINLESGEKKEYQLGDGVDAREMFLSSNGDKLFFKNMQDQALYYLDLNQ